jgi:arylsulfatase A-like enzyme
VRLEATLDKRGRPAEKALTPVSATRLKTTYPTLAKTFRAAGYATGHFGKWHLGHEPYSAREHGFDMDVPHFPGPGPAGSYLAPWKFAAHLRFQGQSGEHIEDRMAREAVAFLRSNKDRPFFLNYWAFSVHGPWDAKPELVRAYRGKSAPDSPQRNPVYAAMVHSLDNAVGTLMAALEELQIANRTIVVFFSDNGGVHWLDERMKTQFGLESPPTSNAPLRGGKATLYEGGTRVPCIVLWPGRSKADMQTDALLSSVDWAPTLLEMAGVDAAPMQPLDGVSQVPAILGKGVPRDTVYCYFPLYTPATGNLPGVWVRRGDHKLIRFFFDNPDQTDRFELYNLSRDIGERRNLADQMPEKVREMNLLIDEHLKQIKPLLPQPNPAYEQSAALRP